MPQAVFFSAINNAFRKSAFGRVKRSHVSSALLLTAGCLFLTCLPLRAQDAVPTSDDTLEANPNRPSSSNSAEVLAPGVVQWEYGWSKEWDGGGQTRGALGGEIRLGVWKNAEFRWGGDALVDATTPAAHHIGFGDQYLSGQAQLMKQSDRAPALALSYAVGFPTGNQAFGLGSGSMDHTFTFLASKEIRKFTWDFNAGYQLIGRNGAAGFDRDSFFIFTSQHDLYGPLSIIGEIGGTTTLNATSPAYSTTLWALAYKLNRRVVLDAAIDVGITHGAPQKRIMFGITYAITKLHLGL